MLAALDLSDVTLVGFSMGGGKVARYFSKYGAERLHSVVFASAVPPYLMQSPGNSEGPLTKTEAAKMGASLTAGQDSFGATDFRDDLPKVSVPVLVPHGDSDQVVPFEGSGRRTHEAIQGSELHLIIGAPHGCNVSHAEEFSQALLKFLAT